MAGSSGIGDVTRYRALAGLPPLTTPTNSTATGSGGGVRAYSPQYGGVPILPSSNNLYSNLNGILNQAIPGFNSLTSKSSGIIGNALNGELPRDVQNQITDASATQAVMGGMPGSNGTSGTLYGNRTLRDLGLTSLNRQDTGVKDLIGFLQGVSGTAAPNYQQVQGQQNAIQQYAAAPEPAAAAKEQQNLYDKYSNPAAGTVPKVSAGGGGGSGLPWWYSPNDRSIVASNQPYSVDPQTGGLIQRHVFG